MYLQIWGRRQKELGGGNAILAVSVGYCHWLLLLYGWGRPAVPHWGAPTSTGYCQGQHHSFSQGGTDCATTSHSLKNGILQ